MSRYYWDKKATVESCLKLKVESYRKAFEQKATMGTTIWKGTEQSIGFQTTNKEGEILLQLSYCQKKPGTEVDVNIDYTVPITTTGCYFGGIRYWFHCPSCGRRASTLYQKGMHFGCRICQNLTYSARQENRRSSFYPILKEVETLQEFEKLRDSLRVKFYKGKPTKQYLKLVKLYFKIETYGEQMQTSLKNLEMTN